MIEEWKPIKNYEELYQVSNLGRVKRIVFINNICKKAKEKILKQRKTNAGYLQVCLCKSGKTRRFYVHRLVADAFIPNTDNLPQVNHKDEDKANNNADNLEWCTILYNNCYGARLRKISAAHEKKVCQYDKDGNFIRIYNSIKEASEVLNICGDSISKCCRGISKTAGGFVWVYKGVSNEKEF